MSGNQDRERVLAVAIANANANANDDLDSAAEGGRAVDARRAWRDVLVPGGLANANWPERLDELLGTYR